MSGKRFRRVDAVVHNMMSRMSPEMEGEELANEREFNTLFEEKWAYEHPRLPGVPTVAAPNTASGAIAHILSSSIYSILEGVPMDARRSMLAGARNAVSKVAEDEVRRQKDIAKKQALAYFKAHGRMPETVYEPTAGDMVRFYGRQAQAYVRGLKRGGAKDLREHVYVAAAHGAMSGLGSVLHRTNHPLLRSLRLEVQEKPLRRYLYVRRHVQGGTTTEAIENIQNLVDQIQLSLKNEGTTGYPTARGIVAEETSTPVEEVTIGKVEEFLQTSRTLLNELRYQRTIRLIAQPSITARGKNSLFERARNAPGSLPRDWKKINEKDKREITFTIVPITRRQVKGIMLSDLERYYRSQTPAESDKRYKDFNQEYGITPNEAAVGYEPILRPEHYDVGLRGMMRRLYDTGFKPRSVRSKAPEIVRATHTVVPPTPETGEIPNTEQIASVYVRYKGEDNRMHQVNLKTLGQITSWVNQKIKDNRRCDEGDIFFVLKGKKGKAALHSIPLALFITRNLGEQPIGPKEPPITVPGQGRGRTEETVEDIINRMKRKSGEQRP